MCFGCYGGVWGSRESRGGGMSARNEARCTYGISRQIPLRRCVCARTKEGSHRLHSPDGPWLNVNKRKFPVSFGSVCRRQIKPEQPHRHTARWSGYEVARSGYETDGIDSFFYP